MLRGVVAEARISAEAGADDVAAAIMTAKKIVFLYCMI